MKPLKAWKPAMMVATLATMGVMASHVPGYADMWEGMDADLRIGVYTDAEGFAIGGGVLTPVGANTGWFFNPNLEIAMPNGDNVITINGDFHYDIPTTGNFSPYVGAGPAVLRQSGETDVGVNVLAGLAGLQGTMRPFAQIKGLFADNSEFALMGGIRF
jgi:hypothetical protein